MPCLLAPRTKKLIFCDSQFLRNSENAATVGNEQTSKRVMSWDEYLVRRRPRPQTEKLRECSNPPSGRGVSV